MHQLIQIKTMAKKTTAFPS